MKFTYSKIETADGSFMIREHRTDRYKDRWVSDQNPEYLEALAEENTPRVTFVPYVAPVIEERTQSDPERRYQEICTQLGFTEKPGVDELLAKGVQLVQQDVITMDELTFLKWEIDGVNTKLQVREGLMWEDWIWVTE
jgi:hypothetical protein